MLGKAVASVLTEITLITKTSFFEAASLNYLFVVANVNNSVRGSKALRGT